MQSRRGKLFCRKRKTSSFAGRIYNTRNSFVTEKGREIYDFANKIMFEYVQKIENAIGKEQAIECTNFLNKIKEVVMANTDIIFE